MWRWKLTPQTCASLGTKRTVLNGIAISAVQPSLVDARRRVPHAVPVAIDVRRGAAAAAFAFVEDLLFELGAERRRHEHVAVARIVEGVEDHLEVVFVEQPVRIAAHFGGADGKRRVGANADVEVTFVVEDAHLGAIGGGLVPPAAPAARTARRREPTARSASSRMPSTFNACEARTARATGFSVGNGLSLMIAGLAAGVGGCWCSWATAGTEHERKNAPSTVQ